MDVLSEVRKLEIKRLGNLLKGQRSPRCVLCGEKTFLLLTKFPFHDGKGYFWLCIHCYCKGILSHIKCCANCDHYVSSSTGAWFCLYFEEVVENPYGYVCGHWREASFNALR